MSPTLDQGRLAALSESPICNPPSYCIFDGENPISFRFELAFQRVRVYFQWNRLVASAVQETSHVKLTKARNTQLAILFNVDQFMEQQPTGEWSVRDDHIAERDRSRCGLVRQFLEA